MHLAEESSLGKLVVLKALRSEMAADSHLREMFLHEAQLSALLRHPNVVQVTRVCEHEHVPIIVMEFLDGQSLAQVRSRLQHEVPLRHHLQILSSVLQGLHYSHELAGLNGKPLGLVHRDVTPHNIFLTYDGWVKIVDFGIAKLASASSTTPVGMIKGKLNYMPREQILGDQPLDRRTDIYSVGVMLWEALARRRMWSGQPYDVTISRVLAGRLPTLDDSGAEYPQCLSGIYARATAMDRQDRYESAADFARELAVALDELGGPVSPERMGAFLHTEFGAVQEANRRAIETALVRRKRVRRRAPLLSGAPSVASTLVPKQRKRRSWGSVLLGGLSVAAAAAVIWLWLGQVRESARDLNVAAPVTGPEEAPVRAAARRDVRLTVETVPSAASVELDGVPLEGTPPAAEVLPAAAVRWITVAAPGHSSQRRAVVIDRDVAVRVELIPSAEPPQSAERPQPAERPLPPASMPRPVASPVEPQALPADCSPPYTIDARGIKRFRPECI